MTDFEKKYLIKLVEKDYKEAQINYEQGIRKHGIPFEDIMNLAHKKIAREQIADIVKSVLKYGIEDELL